MAVARCRACIEAGVDGPALPGTNLCAAHAAGTAGPRGDTRISSSRGGGGRGLSHADGDVPLSIQAHMAPTAVAGSQLPCCPVCLEDIHMNDLNTFTWPGCEHPYHLECAWSQVNSSGPQCRCALCRHQLPEDLRSRLLRSGQEVVVSRSPAPASPQRGDSDAPVEPTNVHVLCCQRLGPPPDYAPYADRRMEWSTRRLWQRDADGRLQLQRHPRSGVLQGVPQGWWAGWTCHGCSRELASSEVTVDDAGAPCPNGCGPRVWALDLHAGSAHWQCSRPTCGRSTTDSLPVFFTRGPLCGNGRVYGWGNPPLTVPGQGPQSWLFCPLISLGLLQLEQQTGLQPWSIGQRAEVPQSQSNFWLGWPQASSVIQQYSAFFRSPSGQAAFDVVSQPSRWRGGRDQPADHLSGQDQEMVTPQAIIPELEVLAVELAAWSPHVGDSCIDAHVPARGLSAAPPAQCLTPHRLPPVPALPSLTSPSRLAQQQECRSLTPTSPASPDCVAPDGVLSATHGIGNLDCAAQAIAALRSEISALRETVASLRLQIQHGRGHDVCLPVLQEIRDLLSHAHHPAPHPPPPSAQPAPLQSQQQSHQQQTPCDRGPPMQHQPPGRSGQSGHAASACSHAGCNRPASRHCASRTCALHCTSSDCGRHRRRRVGHAPPPVEAPSSDPVPRPASLPSPPPPPPPMMCSEPSCNAQADGRCRALRCASHCNLAECRAHGGRPPQAFRAAGRPAGCSAADQWSGDLWHQLQSMVGNFSQSDIDGLPPEIRGHIEALQCARSGEDWAPPRQRGGRRRHH